jgi:hypothetical protein
MRTLLVRVAIVVGAGVVWFAGFRLFLQSDLSRARKVGWATFLVLVGIVIGVLLPVNHLWSMFLLLIVISPLLGLADVLLFRSGRGLSFWIRACGFEVCTVFGVATATRFVLDHAGLAAFVSAAE